MIRAPRPTLSPASVPNAPLSTGGRSPIWFFTLTVLFTVAVLAALGWHIYRSDQVNKGEHERDFRLKEVSGVITHLDEVLTMSARMAAVTGDAQWDERYRRFESQLDEAITEAQRLAPEVQSGEAAHQTDVANKKLVDMEHQALELVRQGRLAEAYAVLFSEEYEAQKWIYSQGMQRFTALLEQRVADGQSARRTRTTLSIIIIAVALLLSLIVWAAVLWVMRRWQAALVENNRQLELTAAKLRDLNKTLDEKVDERTIQLHARNEELARQQQAARSLNEELQASHTKLEAHNRELASREQVMQSLLEDLNTAKERIEQQAGALQAANEKLKDLAVLKDDFIAKVSHELRTPLTSIKEGVSLMLDGALGATTADQQDFLATMDGDIDRLTELINNMLDISKIEAGHMRLFRARVDLPKLVESVLKSCQSLLGKRTVQVDAAAGPAQVFGDANRLTQVLTNLLSNAIKFTPEGGRIVFRIAPRNGVVAVGVEDNGPGIAPEDLKRLFQKFSQVGQPSSGGYRGTGLGLVVCKELTELHGGRIEVASTVGAGTTFTVSLPVYTDQFALTEGFREQLRAASAEEGPAAVSLIAVDARPLLNPAGSPAERAAALEQAAADVRQYLHRGDLVLSVDPGWVVALSATDARGAAAIIKRLREKLREGGRLRFGAAVCPLHGQEAAALLAHATTHLNQDLASAVPAEAPNNPSIQTKG
jgi:signal transduction histidine kinase